MTDETSTYPREQDFANWQARQEYEAQIGEPRTRDFRMGKAYCYWCGAKKIDGKCPNPEC